MFDCTEIENGYSVWRASIWENQYQATMLAKPGTARTVARGGIALACNLALQEHVVRAQQAGCVYVKAG